MKDTIIKIIKILIVLLLWFPLAFFIVTPLKIDAIYKNFLFGAFCLPFVFLANRMELKRHFRLTVAGALVAAASVAFSVLVLLNQTNVESARVGYYVFYHLFSVALIEELIFRGFIADILFKIKRLHPIFAIAISAVLFGLIHIPWTVWSHGDVLPRFVFPTIIGLGFATIFYFYRNLPMLIIIHAGSNIAAYIGGGAFDIVYFSVFDVGFPAVLILIAIAKKIVEHVRTRSTKSINLSGNFEDLPNSEQVGG